MKIKRLTTMLLTAAMLTCCLLPLTGCKKGETTPENPFAVDGTDEGENRQPGNDTGTGWTADNPHGEKILYGKQESSTGSILRFGDMLIGMTNYSNCWGYFSFDAPKDAKLICFDPLCLHLSGQDSCPSNINRYKSDTTPSVPYPMGIYIDQYENADAPVIYYYYLRDDFYRINYEESGERDPVYCIERYDLSQGKRYAILDNVEHTIQQACNYGDYVYYVLDMGDEKGQELYRIHKSGGESEKFDLEEIAESIRIADAIDDKFYYIVDERYIYQADLDLTDGKTVLDMKSVKGENGSNGVIQGSYSGYLYYLADFETVWEGTPGESSSQEKANLYRIPMNDLTKAPEKMVDGMIGTGDRFKFTEKTLYYLPGLTQSDEGEAATNQIEGTIMALDLKTGKSKTIVEDCGVTISRVLPFRVMA